MRSTAHIQYRWVYGTRASSLAIVRYRGRTLWTAPADYGLNKSINAAIDAARNMGFTHYVASEYDGERTRKINGSRPIPNAPAVAV
jgi:hypothetical protein